MNKLREDILIRIKDEEYRYNLCYYFTIKDNQKVLDEIEKIKQDKEYLKKFHYPYFEDIKIFYDLSFNCFCYDVHIKMSRPSMYKYKIEEIKNDPKTKEDYIKYIKERRDKKIKSLKKFLEENEDSFEEDMQELQYLNEKIEEFEKRAWKIKSKYREILIP